MRHIPLTAILVAALAAPAASLAQTDAETNKVIEMVRTNVKREKTAVIGVAMGFMGDQAAKFWPIYKDYEAELHIVGDERVALIKDYASHFESMSDQKAAELAGKALEQEQKRLDLLKKYNARLAKEMSPVVAARFVQVENRLNLILDLKMAAETPLIQKAGL